MIRCEDLLTQLDDYIDDELSVKDARLVAAHLDECEVCRAEEHALRQLVERARSLPKSVMPRRDLWNGIEAQIEGRVVAFETRSARRFSSRVWAPLMSFAAAVAVVATLVFSRDIDDAFTPPVVQENPVLAGELEYMAAKEALLTELASTGDSLSPEIVATVEDNLRIIEDAVLQLRTALADEPNNPQLERLLVATYKSQVELLQQAVLFSNDS